MIIGVLILIPITVGLFVKDLFLQAVSIILELLILFVFFAFGSLAEKEKELKEKLKRGYKK